MTFLYLSIFSCLCAEQSTSWAGGPVQCAFSTIYSSRTWHWHSICWKEQVDFIGHFTMTTVSSHCQDNSLHQLRSILQVYAYLDLCKDLQETVERFVAYLVSSIYICSTAQQQLNNFHMSVSASKLQRSRSILQWTSFGGTPKISQVLEYMPTVANPSFILLRLASILRTVRSTGAQHRYL